MTSRLQLDGIQALRGLAAGLVLVEHTVNAISTRYLGIAPIDSPLSIFPFPVGVDIFFVISGFIIAYSSRSLYGQPGAWRQFALRRSARVVPLYWLTTSFMIVAFIAIGSRAWSDASWWSVAASYLFLPAANAEGLVYPILTVGWTLNYEMAFYVLFAMALVFTERVALSVVVGLLVLLAALGALAQPVALAPRFWTSPIILEFAAGIGLYWLYRTGNLSLPSGARSFLAIAAVSCLALATADPGAWRWLVWGGPATLLVAAALGTGTVHGAMATGIRRAGDWSYGIYLAHVPIAMIGAMACQLLLPQTNWVWFGLFPVYVVVTSLAVAALLHRWVERPLMDRARNSFPAKEAIKAETGAGAPKRLARDELGAAQAES